MLYFTSEFLCLQLGCHIEFKVLIKSHCWQHLENNYLVVRIFFLWICDFVPCYWRFRTAFAREIWKGGKGVKSQIWHKFTLKQLSVVSQSIKNKIALLLNLHSKCSYSSFSVLCTLQSIIRFNGISPIYLFEFYYFNVREMFYFVSTTTYSYHVTSHCTGGFFLH